MRRNGRAAADGADERSFRRLDMLGRLDRSGLRNRPSSGLRHLRPLSLVCDRTGYADAREREAGAAEAPAPLAGRQRNASATASDSTRSSASRGQISRAYIRICTGRSTVHFSGSSLSGHSAARRTTRGACRSSRSCSMTRRARSISDRNTFPRKLSPPWSKALARSRQRGVPCSVMLCDPVCVHR